MEIAGRTDVGRTRAHNEDSFLLADLTERQTWQATGARTHTLGERGSLLVVADGMGGAAAGEVASQMATESIYAHLVNTWMAERDGRAERFALRLKEAVESANTRIHAHSSAHPEVRGMGTTATAAGVLGDHVFLTQIGDSRAYLVRNGQAIQLTKDQSLTQRLVEAGEMTEEAAAQSDRKNIILQALGPDAKVKVDLTFQELRRGDVLVLCSDGLSGQVKKEEIAGAVTRQPDLARAGAGKELDLRPHSRNRYQATNAAAATSSNATTRPRLTSAAGRGGALPRYTGTGSVLVSVSIRG